MHTRQAAGWSVAISVAMIVVGALAIAAPLIAGVAVDGIVAWLIIVGGFAHLFFAFHARGVGGHVWEAVVGVALVAFGIWMFLHPLAGLVGLTLVLGVYFLIKGVSEVAAWFAIRRVRGSVWMIVDGVVSLVLAGFVVAHLFGTATWLLGTLVGFAILFSGISRLMLASTARRGLVEAV